MGGQRQSNGAQYAITVQTGDTKLSKNVDVITTGSVVSETMPENIVPTKQIEHHQIVCF